MREIKFRAWDNKTKQMFENYAVNDLSDGGIRTVAFHPSSDMYMAHWELMQYTSLKDKNDKEIFEGDIIRTQPYSDKPYAAKKKFKQHLGVVEYRIGTGNFHSKEGYAQKDYSAEWSVRIEDEGGYGCHNWGPFFDCEVIGNIYENPELLKQSK